MGTKRHRGSVPRDELRLSRSVRSRYRGKPEVCIFYGVKSTFVYGVKSTFDSCKNEYESNVDLTPFDSSNLRIRLIQHSLPCEIMFAFI
jgi:hypothetical protein